MSTALIQPYTFKNYQDDEDDHSDLRSFQSDESLEILADVNQNMVIQESPYDAYYDTPSQQQTIGTASVASKSPKTVKSKFSNQKRGTTAMSTRTGGKSSSITRKTGGNQPHFYKKGAVLNQKFVQYMPQYKESQIQVDNQELKKIIGRKNSPFRNAHNNTISQQQIGNSFVQFEDQNAMKSRPDSGWTRGKSQGILRSSYSQMNVSQHQFRQMPGDMNQQEFQARQSINSRSPNNQMSYNTISNTRMTNASSKLSVKKKLQPKATMMPADHPFYKSKFIKKKKVVYSHCYDIDVKFKGIESWEGEALKNLPKILKILQDAKTQEKNKKYKEAVQILQKLNSSGLNFSEVTNEYTNGEIGDAIRQSLYLLAWCLYKTKDYKLANETFSQLDRQSTFTSELTIKSSFTEHKRYYIWGKVLNHLQKHEEAVQQYDRALKVMEEKESVNVDYTELEKTMIKQRLGFSHILMTRNDVAADDMATQFQKAVDDGIEILKEIEPVIPRKHQLRFIVAQALLEVKKNPDEALEYANKALDDKSNDEATLLLWTKMMVNSTKSEKNQDLQDSLDILQKSQDKKIREKSFLYAGQLLEQDPATCEEAKNKYAQCLQLNNKNLAASLHQAYIFTKLGKFNEAIELFNASIEARRLRNKQGKRGMDEQSSHRKIIDLNSLSGLADAYICVQQGKKQLLEEARKNYQLCQKQMGAKHVLKKNYDDDPRFMVAEVQAFLIDLQIDTPLDRKYDTPIYNAQSGARTMQFFNKNIKLYNERFQLYIDGITDPKMKQESLQKLSTYCLACANHDLAIQGDESEEPSKQCYEYTESAIKYQEQILSIDETSRPLINRKLGTYYQGYIFYKPGPTQKSNAGLETVQASFKNEEKAIQFLENAINSWNQKDNTPEENYGIICDQRVALCQDDDYEKRIELYTKALTLEVKFYKVEIKLLTFDMSDTKVACYSDKQSEFFIKLAKAYQQTKQYDLCLEVCNRYSKEEFLSKSKDEGAKYLLTENKMAILVIMGQVYFEQEKEQLAEEEKKYNDEMAREDSDEEPKERKRRQEHLQKAKAEKDAATRKFDKTLSSAEKVQKTYSLKDILDPNHRLMHKDEKQNESSKECPQDKQESLKAILDAGILIAKTYEEMGQIDLAIKSFKFYQSNVNKDPKGFNCLQNFNYTHYMINKPYFDNKSTSQSNSNFVKTQKSYMDKRLAQITEKCDSNWDKFDKSRVGMLSSGQVKFMVEDQLKSLDPTALYLLQQPADAVFLEFYESWGEQNISKATMPKFIYGLIHEEFNIPDPEEKNKLSKDQVAELTKQFEQDYNQEKSGMITKDQLTNALKSTFAELKHEVNEDMLNNMLSKAEFGEDGKAKFEVYIQAITRDDAPK